jgi:hypothetical protein
MNGGSWDTKEDILNVDHISHKERSIYDRHQFSPKVCDEREKKK